MLSVDTYDLGVMPSASIFSFRYSQISLSFIPDTSYAKLLRCFDSPWRSVWWCLFSHGLAVFAFAFLDKDVALIGLAVRSG